MTPARPAYENAMFYPLYNLACRSAKSVRGEMIIARMMRGKGIQVSFGPMHAKKPTLVHCRDCKLGFVASKRQAIMSVECIHGPWSRNADERVRVAALLGANVACCDICGERYSWQTETWEFLGENPAFYRTLRYCGQVCRDRARAMLMLA